VGLEGLGLCGDEFGQPFGKGDQLADALIAFLGQAPGAELRAARSSRPSGLTPF
jgi:hypothetical protein